MAPSLEAYGWVGVIELVEADVAEKMMKFIGMEQNMARNG